MANQLNFPNSLQGTFLQRPSRLEKIDTDVVRSDNHQILFGTTQRDVVSVWVYNPDGSIAGHELIRPNDPALSLTTLIDNIGPVELLNIDMKDVANRMDIQPGRYGLVLNFLRDEVGSEEGYRLYIVDISDDRTEVRLSLVHESPEAVKDIFEWVVPSVPRIFAQGLIDEIFNKSLDNTSLQEEHLQETNIRSALSSLIANTLNRVQYADIDGILNNTINMVIARAYSLILDNLALDSNNFNIQREELETYFFNAIDTVIYQMQQSGEIDPRLQVM